MNPLNLDAYSLSLLAAKEDIVSGRSSTDWAIFTYEKRWSLKLQDSGAGGLEEFIKKLSSESVLYGLCRVTDPNTKTPRTVLIYWVGDHVDESQREISRSHLPAVQKFFKEADALVSAQRVEDLSLEAVVEALTRSAPPVRTFHRPRVSGSHEGVGTNYRKTNPAAEMRFSNRESFWERSEREEERRKEEERARIVEERIALEKERIQRERAEEEERERRIREKERLVEEQRKEQVRLEAERSRMEKTRWVQQQKEYEEEMRGRFKRSQSIEMAAEAALLVSHRTMHPRDFFRQQERSVSCSSPPSTPNSPSRSPQSFFPRQTFRYQRSLTESILPQSPRSPHCSPSTQNWNPMMSPPGPQPLSPAFIFSKSALPATSPRADSLPSFIPPPIALNRAVPFQNKTSPPTHVQKVTSPKLLPQDASGGAEPDVEHPQKPLEAQPPHNSSGDLSLQARPLPPSTTQAYTTVETTLQSAPLTAETTLQSAPLTLETTLQSAPLTAETTLQTTPPSTDIIPQIASSTVQTTPLTATPTSEIIHQTAPSSVETTLQTSSAMEEMPLQITPPTSVTILQNAPSIAENTVQSAPPPAETTLNSAEAPAEDALRPIQTTLPPAPSAPYTANSIPIADPLDTQYTSSVTTPLESPLNAQATPSERAPTHQGQPSDVSLTGNPLAFEGHPIANLAGLEAPPTESSLTFEVLPTDNLVAFEAPPSESLTSKASPTNTLVAFEAPPAESPLTCDVTPTGNLIEFEAPPTENTLTHEAPPTDNLVALEVPPTESSLICDATPTDNLIEFKALPSEISLTHEAPPTDRFVAFEGPPTESTLMCEAPPIDNFSAFEAPPTESSLMREDPPTDNLAAFEAPLIESSLKCKAPPINDLVTFEAPPTERSLVSQTPKPETSDCESQVLQPQTPGGEPEHSATGGALYAPGHQSPVSTDIKEHPSDGLF